MKRRLLVLPSILLSLVGSAQPVWTPAAPLTTGPGEDTHASFITSSEDFLWWGAREWVAFRRSEDNGAVTSIRVLRSSPNAQSWPDTPMTVIRDSAGHDFPSIARGIRYSDTEEVCIAWEKTDASGGSFVYVSAFADSEWSVPILIDRGGGDDHRPSLAASDSEFALAWIRRGTVIVSFRRSGTWSLPVTISPPADTLCVLPRIYHTTYPPRWCIVWQTRKPGSAAHALFSAILLGGVWEVDTVAWTGDNRKPVWFQRSWFDIVQVAWEANTLGRWEVMAREGRIWSGPIAWGSTEVLSTGTADNLEPAVELFPVITGTGSTLVFATATAWRCSTTGGSDSIALGTWMTERTYRSGGAGAVDRNPAISGGVPANGVRVWAVWESNAGGTWHLYASSVDVPLGAVEDEGPPADARLSAAYPNPFNGTTRCTVDLAARSPVRLDVVDVLGREAGVILEGILDAGRHTAIWDAGGMPSGVYVLRLRATGGIRTTKVVVLR